MHGCVSIFFIDGCDLRDTLLRKVVLIFFISLMIYLIKGSYWFEAFLPGMKQMDIDCSYVTLHIFYNSSEVSCQVGINALLPSSGTCMQKIAIAIKLS